MQNKVHRCRWIRGRICNRLLGISGLGSFFVSCWYHITEWMAFDACFSDKIGSYCMSRISLNCPRKSILFESVFVFFPCFSFRVEEHRTWICTDSELSQNSISMGIPRKARAKSPWIWAQASFAPLLRRDVIHWYHWHVNAIAYWLAHPFQWASECWAH